MVDKVALDALTDLIKRFEGIRLTPYRCPAGVWTCGWGSTGPDVVPGVRWTHTYANYRMRRDALTRLRAVKTLCPGLEGAQLAAIADFAYNLGLGALKASTLLRRLQARQYEDVPYQLSRWVYAGGRRLNGLVYRRTVEAGLFTSAGVGCQPR